MSQVDLRTCGNHLCKDVSFNRSRFSFLGVKTQREVVILRCCVLWSVVFSCTPNVLFGQTSSAREIVRLVSEKQQNFIDVVSKAVSVDVRYDSISAVKTRAVNVSLSYSLHLQGDNLLRMTTNARSGNIGQLEAKNTDYFFSLSKSQLGNDSAYSLESLDTDMQDKTMLRSQASAMHSVLASVYFFGMSLPEVFGCNSFRLQDASEVDGLIFLMFDFKHPVSDVEFSNVMLEIDTANGFQLASVKCQYGSPLISMQSDFEYSETKFVGVDCLQLKRKVTVEAYQSQDGVLDEDRYISTYSNWSQVPIDDSMFRVSGYGFPEPNLNKSIGWFRWFVILLVGGFGLMALIKGNRLLSRKGSD